MKFLTVQDLKKAHAAGQVMSVSLVADVEAFEVRVVMASGSAGVTQDDGQSHMRFADPAEALLMLNELDIVAVHVHTDGWVPSPGSQNYMAWLTAKVQSSAAGINDGSNKVFSADEWASIRRGADASLGRSS
ncbi:hypothetical protein GJ699_16600 [Duganella sp. FT80W]|uniref:Uncharacterized protein n=1 Tax=Duganella guangzhouensis TaxID=2666084 RepID=A0A6I2KZK1_9BURK|nr:hypothetical protein [Duganella guangzhouensis]MRW91615.1 hypothetical protein [Duganella guangzhouensis]